MAFAANRVAGRTSGQAGRAACVRTAVARTSGVSLSVMPKAPSMEAVQQPQDQLASTRRALIATAVLLPLVPKAAYAVTASSLCVDTQTEEEDTACRRGELAKDAANKEDYGKITARKFEVAPNVPVGELNDEYTQATLKLMEQIELYCSLDVYDKSRVPLIKALKADSAAWVSKYARGGSVRSQSARRLYVAVDAVSGHLASNGLAPLAAPKVRAVLKNVNEAKDFLAKGI